MDMYEKFKAESMIPLIGIIVTIAYLFATR